LIIDYCGKKQKTGDRVSGYQGIRVSGYQVVGYQVVGYPENRISGEGRQRRGEYRIPTDTFGTSKEF